MSHARFRRNLLGTARSLDSTDTHTCGEGVVGMGRVGLGQKVKAARLAACVETHVRTRKGCRPHIDGLILVLFRRLNKWHIFEALLVHC